MQTSSINLSSVTNVYSNLTLIERPQNTKAVYWLFYIGSQAERVTPDRIYAAVLVAIFVLAIVSHLPSFLILIRDGKRSYINNGNIIYRNLFAIDILLIFGFLPFEIYWTLTRQSVIICKLLKFVGFSFFFGGCIFIIILAIDRYHAIFNPLKHMTSEYRHWLILSICLTWIFSLGMGLWQAAVHHVGPSEDDDQYFLCGADQSVAQSFFVPGASLFTFLPLLVTVGINSCISMKLVWRDKDLNRQGCANCRLCGGICLDHQDSGCLFLEKAKIERIMKMKTVRMTVVMAFCFVICQIPAATLYLIAWNSRAELSCMPSLLIDLCMALRPLYVVIIPLLHGSVMDRSQVRGEYKLTATRTLAPPVFCSQL